MKKKYEKPEMIIEVMELDTLRASCTIGGTYSKRNLVHTVDTCSCCLSPAYHVSIT